MSDTKYGDLVGNALEDEPDDTEPNGPPTRVDSHKVDVILTTDPHETMGYGREKYTATIEYDDETGDPYVLYVIEHRWKGNYWRDVTDWDWRDVPGPVREKIAAILPVDSPEDRDSGARLIDEGGESRWEKYHKPRVESTNGGEIWGVSSLTDALKSVKGAAEQFDGGSDAEARAEEIVSEIRELIGEVRGDSDG